ncbi:unnamed protein product [Orchesella dallaii]|uniref:Uncharacterized protein n=1 Tax=Orchesella dallaii TaxID=48710 RepID=A0ABP1Q9W7_9HEXA
MQILFPFVHYGASCYGSVISLICCCMCHRLLFVDHFYVCGPNGGIADKEKCHSSTHQHDHIYRGGRKEETLEKSFAQTLVREKIISVGKTVENNERNGIRREIEIRMILNGCQYRRRVSERMKGKGLKGTNRSKAKYYWRYIM